MRRLAAVSLVVLVCLGAALADEKPKADKKQPQGLLPKAWLERMPWRPVGPANMGGRITSLAVYEKDPTLWWAATASGGLLKTVDNGITFEHQFDREAVVSIGDVAVAQTDPNIVWVGTGECNPRNSVSWGNGVYKSTDGGATWKHMGLKGSFQIGAVRIHPKNPDIVYVGALGRLWGPNAERGLFKTTDGGTTWEKIWYLDDKTGVIDVQMHPQDPDTLLIATYERQRDEFDTNDPAKKWGPGSGLWKTTDGGQNFKRITTGLPTGKLGRIGIEYFRKNPDHVYLVLESEKIGTEPPNAPYMGITGQNADVGARLTNVVKGGPAAKAGLRKDDVIIGIDDETVHSYTELLRGIRRHVAGDKVKVEVSRERKSVFLELTLGKRPQPKARKGAAPKGGGRQARMRSPFGAFLGGQRANLQDQQGKDGHEYGGVYRSTDGGESWTRINTVNPRPMYFSELRVDPSDENHVWVLGIRLWKSKDGGKTFTNDGAPGNVHVDHHALWIDPDNGRHLILGNDGGVYISYDRGKHFDHLNHVAIGQFYDVGVGPRRNYRVYGGLQDNGSWGGPSRVRHASGPTNEDWIRIGGGDGFRVRVDKHDPYRIYFESQNGNVGRRHLRTGERAMMRPRPPKGSQYRFNWYTPFILSHHNSRIYYTAGNHVFRSLDRGNGMRSISPEITPTKRGSATALAESPRNPDLLYVGTDDGGVWMTRDGGHTWIDLYAPPSKPDPTPREAGGAKPDIAERESGNGDAKKAADAPKKGKRARPKPPPKPKGPSLLHIQSDRRYVSWIEPSRHATDRVYLVFDGHRSDDDRALVFVSEDKGTSWKALHANIPAAAGTTRVLREDIVNPDILYLGTEMGAYVSIDRGATWTSMNTNLPTVAVHQIAQHPTAGEIVAGTHGRSLWIMDVTTLRQVTKDVLATSAGHLFKPNVAIQWRPEPSRGRSRTFVGKNPPTGATIHYVLGRVPAAKLEIRKLDGTVVRTLEAEGGPGLHAVTWNLRANPRPRRRFGARVQPGTYKVVLTVGAKAYEVDLRVEMDPDHSDPDWMPHEDEAEEGAAAKKAKKAFRYEPYDSGRDE
ncbi:MAG: PDZ domain-containing protein [Planctomycetota bacterium]|nr:PDZ domain-containing protein [Planctomycetota bacterium]